MIGYRRLQTLRDNVKSGKLPVRATNTFGRNWRYCKEDIEKHLLNASFNHQPQYAN